MSTYRSDQNSTTTQYCDSLAPARLALSGLPSAFDLAPPGARLSALAKLQTENHEISGLTLGATLHYLLSQPPVLLLTLTFIAAHFVSAIFWTWMPLFFYEKFHLSLAVAGFSAVIFIQIAGALSALCNGWLADKMARSVPYGRVLLQAFYLLLGAGTIVFIGQATVMTTLIVAMMLFGFCKGGYDIGVFATLFDYIHPAMRGSASGVILSFGWLGGALGPALVGLIATYGGASNMALHRMSVAISASALAYLLAALLLLSILPYHSKNRSASS